MSYEKAIKVFEDLPEECKKLRRYDYNRNGGKCAIGVLVDVKPQHEGFGIDQLLEDRRVQSQLEGFNTKYIKDRLDELEMTNEEAADLQQFVDGHSQWVGGESLFNEALRFMKEKTT